METTTTHHKAPKRRLEEQGSESAPVDMEQEQPPTPTLAPTPAPAEHPCNIPGCEVAFGSAARLEVHFKAAHLFTCAECHRAFSSHSILDRHLEEHHDPFFQVSYEKRRRPHTPRNRSIGRTLSPTYKPTLPYHY